MRPADGGLHRTDTLKKAQARYERAAAASERALTHRNSLIRAALQEGLTHAEIATATGLTRGRVGQYAQQLKHE